MKRFIHSFFNYFGYDFVKSQYNNADLSKHLLNVFTHKKIDCVIDVGANRGQYGELLRRTGFKGHIVSFEPVKSVFAVLKEECDKDNEWHCYNLALGEKREIKNINVYGGNSNFSSFLEANDYSKKIWSSLESCTNEEVSVVRLDEVYDKLVGSLGVTNVMLKMDTQGYDKNVFKGAGGCLKNIKALQSELPLISVYKDMLQFYDILKLFNECNYYISGMYPVNRDESLAVIEYDCILVKKMA